MEFKSFILDAHNASQQVLNGLDLDQQKLIEDSLRLYLLVSNAKNLDFDDQDEYYLSNLAVLNNVCSALVEGGFQSEDLAQVELGIELLTKYKEDLIKANSKGEYYYNLGNAIRHKNDLSNLEDSIYSINKMHDVKTAYWNSYYEGKSEDYRLLTNLGSTLVQQHRVIEAISLFDKALNINHFCWQARLERTRALIDLSKQTNTYSIELLMQIKDGFKLLIANPTVPNFLIENVVENYEYYNSLFLKNIGESCENIDLEIEDKAQTKKEAEQLSEYRKFCLDNDLSLSEHSVYCICEVSKVDDLNILSRAPGPGNIAENEFVLNRLKSEFSFARRMFFEYQKTEKSIFEELYLESNFSELNDGEILGIKIEKLKASYKQCFSILDKIANGVCQEFNLAPDEKNCKIYFNSFWRLEKKEEQYKRNNYKGISALYSIALDINEKKINKGGLHHLKHHRNKIEHDFFSIFKNTQDINEALYKNQNFKENIITLTLGEFENDTLLLLKLTRSAIFSFALAVREKSEKLKNIIDSIYEDSLDKEIITYSPKSPI
ncbi:LA2681 family HEPN domain-containing protein [Vibrio owensii]|uniref:LA2681 family HEPN domain-containing protein n=1 Tax=Vibrio owensii TaxID=696485 RepID=UPI00406959ED